MTRRRWSSTWWAARAACARRACWPRPRSPWPWRRAAPWCRDPDVDPWDGWLKAGRWILFAVFAGRGLATYVPPVFRYAEGTPFATLNRRAYGPLCLAIALGILVSAAVASVTTIKSKGARLMADRITSPFGAYTDARDVVAGHDLTGKVAIVTGGATGIGIETARALAEAGAEVVIAVRKPDLAEVAVADINKTAKGQGELVDARPLQLQVDPRLRRALGRPAAEPADQQRRGHGLPARLYRGRAGDADRHQPLRPLPAVGAAGPEPGGRRESERQDLAPGVAVVDRPPPQPDELRRPHFRTRPYDKWESYGQAKTANALFAVGFNKRFKDQGVTANAVMPGGIMTPLQRHLPIEEQKALGWIDDAGKVRDGFKTTQQGASTSVWAAVGDELEGVGGLYLEDLAQAKPWTKEAGWSGVMPYALDPEQAERLWALSVATTGAG
jgi:NAD(P)-dependent dehydrogenase (short-subunit alcohol dehydrogenase family)